MRRFFLRQLCLLWLVSPVASAQEVSDLFMTAVEPEGVTYDVGEMSRKMEPGFWQPNQKSWGYGGKTVWLRAIIRNPHNRVLSLMYSSPSRADFFVYDDTGYLLKEVAGGTMAPLQGRELKLNVIGIELDFPNRSAVTVLIRQHSKGLLDTRYILRTKMEHQAIEWIYLAGYGIFFGFMLALFFHNLSLYFSVRDKVYLAYLAYVACLATAVFNASSYYSLFLYRLPEAFHNIPFATASLANLGAGLFTCVYLHLNPRNSKLAIGIVILSLMSLAASLFQLFHPVTWRPLNPYLNVSMFVFMILACVKRIREGERYAMIILAAIITPGFTVLAYYVSNYFFRHSVPFYLVSAAFGVEMLLMSAGLSQRVYVLRQRQHQLKAEQTTLIHQSKLNAMSEMASGVAHEVNNPLMIISGYAELIRTLVDNNPINADKVRENAMRIDHNVHRIAAIVHSLRTFAREDRSAVPELVCLNDLIEQALELCSTQIAESGTQIADVLPPEKLWIHAARTPLLDAIQALLDNAIKAVREVPTKNILIQLQHLTDAAGDRICLVVQDSGPGVPEELQSRLFQPFFTTRAVGEGSGLSLSRCLGVVQTMGGALSYERPGADTRFVIELPYVEP